MLDEAKINVFLQIQTLSDDKMNIIFCFHEFTLIVLMVTQDAFFNT